eukprot:TRINITY_DN10917_c0_g1_i3.p2 TRINITY_DN10917_c0_g1~~TRINITY_DN10917_c0_g1_i3.p2  ORF type:complete len:123 (-),score=2.40 TRINITY_DN10917_c0_g1_i3:86-454(-)
MGTGSHSFLANSSTCVHAPKQRLPVHGTPRSSCSHCKPQLGWPWFEFVGGLGRRSSLSMQDPKVSRCSATHGANPVVECTVRRYLSIAFERHSGIERCGLSLFSASVFFFSTPFTRSIWPLV